MYSNAPFTIFLFDLNIKHFILVYYQVLSSHWNMSANNIGPQVETPQRPVIYGQSSIKVIESPWEIIPQRWD